MISRSPSVLDRRTLLVSAAALLAGAACGGTGSAPATAATRIVRHELGEAAVPAAPQRVVCGTDGGELCSLLALGGRPVGFGQRNDPLRPWVAPLATGIETYDLSAGETDFERLAAWRPDLLLVQEGFATPDTLPTFSAIAPTVATSFIDWRANLRQVGDATGAADRAARLERTTDEAVDGVRAGLGAARGLQVHATGTVGDGTAYLLNDDSPLGKIARALDLAPLPPATTPGEAVNEVSLEQLDVLDGDLLLLLDLGGPDLRQQEVFTRLPVVRDGRTAALTAAESDQLYFDSVLTVVPNAELLAARIDAR